MVLARSKLSRYLKSFCKSTWLFPVVLVVPLLVLTTLRISGSSVGIYSMLSGSNDKNVLTKNYRGVRSDEWLVGTQMIVAQSKNNFKQVNENIGNGQDMSFMDVPYKDWSIIFRPQNLVFFILPLEYAFAFKWWLIGLILVVAVYLLVLELFPKKNMLAILLSVFVGLSPMMLWWYSTGITLCVTYALLAILLAIRIYNVKGSKQRLGYTTLLTYVLGCFALLLYPPFQIPTAIVAGVFFIGYVLENKQKQSWQEMGKAFGFLVLACLLSGMVVGLFLLSRPKAVNLITHTVYPGMRVELNGGVDPLLSFSSFLSPNLQYDNKTAGGYLRNQSEASNFIFIAPYLIVPSIYLIVRQKKLHKKTLWGLILTNTVVVLFLIRMYIASNPLLEDFYKIFFFNKVPSTRILLALGLAGVLQLLLMIKALGEAALKKNELLLMAFFGGVSGLATMVFVGVYTIHHYPQFLLSVPKMLVFSLWVSLGIFLVLKKRFALGVSVLILFSLISVYRVNPLYRGLSPLTSSEPIKSIAAYPANSKWIVLDDRLYINFPVAAGKGALDSVQFYPQLDLWHEIDTTRSYENVYNRFAHVVFSDEESLTQPFTLKDPALIYVKFDACSTFILNHANYVFAEKTLDSPCLVLDKIISTPAKQFYIYATNPVATP